MKNQDRVFNFRFSDAQGTLESLTTSVFWEALKFRVFISYVCLILCYCFICGGETP